MNHQKEQQKATKESQERAPGGQEGDQSAHNRPPTTQNPFREHNPFLKAGAFSRLFYTWMRPIMSSSNKSILQQEDLYPLRPIDKSSNAYKKLRKQFTRSYPTWQAEPGTRTSPFEIVKITLKTYPSYFFFYFLCSVLFSIVEFYNAQIMNMALQGMQSLPPEATTSQKMKVAGKLITALIISDLALTLLKSQNNFIMALLTRRIRNGLNALIFEKVSKKSLSRDNTFSIGDVVNLTQTDTNKFASLSTAANMLFISPFEITAGLIWMLTIIGWKSFLWGAIFLAFSVYGNIYISSMSVGFRAKYMAARDKRGKLVSEVFSNIRSIKMAGLENYFLDRVLGAKGHELKWIQKDLFRRMYSIVLNQATPVLFLASIFTSHIYYYGHLSVPMIFLVMQVYNIFKENFRQLPYLINWVLDILVSTQRIMFFLLSENVEDGYIDRIGSDGSVIVGSEGESRGENRFAIEIENGNFYWSDPQLMKLYQDEKQRIALFKKNQKERSKRRRCFCFKKRKTGSPKTEKDDQDERNEVEESTKRALTRFSLSALDLNLQDLSTLKEKTKRSTKSSTLTQDLRASLLTQPASICQTAYEDITLNLKNINLRIPRGKCVAIIGKVGSGKSSLLSCLGGQLYHQIGAKIKLRGSMAYVSQKAWIQSISVKDNILFGKQLDQSRYEDSIKYSCLTQDLKILQKRDLTLLGDKGVNLSGGQKIRLSIARAMYSNADIYLFDDPISALDIDVGKFVMEEGILGYLRGSTRVVATHAVAYLRLFDYVYVMDEGEIIEEGTYEEIAKTEVYQEIQTNLRRVEEERRHAEEQKEDGSNQGEEKTKEKDQEPKGEVEQTEKGKDDVKQANLAESNKKQGNTKPDQISLTTGKFHPESDTEASSKNQTPSKKESKHAKVIEDIIACEDRTEGSLDWSLLQKWINLMGGLPNLIFLSIVMTVSMFSSAGTPFFLQWWSTNTSDNNPKKPKSWHELTQFVLIYATISGIGILCTFLRTIIVFLGGMELANEVNFKMTFRLIHASINKFYDRVPLGRILNRFIKDVWSIDMMLPIHTNRFIFAMFSTLANLGSAVLASTPVNFIFVAIFVFFSFRVQRFYMRVQREVTRLRAIASSPVIQAFKEEVEGVSTIGFFEASGRLFEEYVKKMDEVQKNFIVSQGATERFNICISLLSLVVVIPCVLSSLLFVSTTAGVFGFMLNYLLQTTGQIRTLLSGSSSMETQLISLERCCYFMDVQPEEGYQGLELLESALREKKKVNLDTKSLSWPQEGRLEIKNLSVKYRQNLPNVLKNINLVIKPGTKVGIVGRTGAGKSTLISAIYRNFDKYEGEICLDGKGISSIDLKLLRKSMTIIPQDPYLFNDSLRNNMDPTHQFTDEAVQTIFEEVHLWEKFESLNGLDSAIESGGSNLSQGEKQLVCLARALLFGKKLVLMDEATANIDAQTEGVIQGLVKDRFKESTILMIAHRLNTVLHCDKVLVLDEGRVLEFDDLRNLEGNPDSHFGRMLRKSEGLEKSLQ